MFNSHLAGELPDALIGENNAVPFKSASNTVFNFNYFFLLYLCLAYSLQVYCLYDFALEFDLQYWSKVSKHYYF